MGIEVRVLGGGGEVGRTGVFLRDSSRNKGLLLDYGVGFDDYGRPLFPEYVKPSDLAGIVISHAHLDHVGAAPLFYISTKPRVVMTKPTLEVSSILIKDMLKISSYYIDYTEEELNEMINSSIVLDYGSELDLDGYNIAISNAGHIIGSALTYIDTPSGERILFTGDLNTVNTYTISAAEPWPGEVEAIIIESTYGGVEHPERHIVEKSLVEAVEATIDGGGVVLIPAFSVGRSQEVLTMIASEMPYVDIYLDGMSREISRVYLRNSKYLRNPDLFRKALEVAHVVRDWSDRRRAFRKPSVIISSAGMLKGGPALYYLKKLADEPKNAIILVSYQSKDSPGHEVLETGSIADLGISVKAKLMWFDLSSHAGRRGLLNIALHYRESLRTVILVHGDNESRDKLTKSITEALPDVKVYAPVNGEQILI
ncbi:MAG: MBL fold metallo-hydrolase [Desulfurococcaceae archaeon]